MATEDKWAIITGASSGIGKALAAEFAAGGYHLLLTARNRTALNEVASECSAKYGIEAEVVAADLSKEDSVESLIQELSARSHRYEVLVNNAGFGIHGNFVSTDIEQDIQLLNLQLMATLKLTHAMLPGMIKNRRGHILNVASVYSFSPVPFQSVYAACKAFLLSFSSSLKNELEGTGVTITVFCPGVTQTEFRTRAGIGEKRKNAGMTAEAVAHVAYAETLRGTHIVVPGLLNRLYVFCAQRLPNGFVPGIIRFINHHRGQSHS